MAMISSVTPKMPKLHAIGGEMDHHFSIQGTLMDNGLAFDGKILCACKVHFASALFQGDKNTTQSIWNNIKLP